MQPYAQLPIKFKLKCTNKPKNVTEYEINANANAKFDSIKIASSSQL